MTGFFLNFFLAGLIMYVHVFIFGRQLSKIEHRTKRWNHIRQLF
jgi:hypothetical protein